MRKPSLVCINERTSSCVRAGYSGLYIREIASVACSTWVMRILVVGGRFRIITEDWLATPPLLATCKLENINKKLEINSQVKCTKCHD